MYIKWLCIISGLMAILAILPWSYEYYQILRIVLFTSASIVSFGFYKSKITGWTIAFPMIAVLFNPIFPIYLTRSNWMGIDLIVGLFFFTASRSIKVINR